VRFLFYSHDGVGFGHVRRHLAIASALVESFPGAKVLIATSVDEVSQLGLPPNIDTLKLPALRKVANDEYCSRRLGLPSEEIYALRSALLQAAVKAFRPAAVLVDKHPFGAGGEFWAALGTARALGARAVLGLRDILDGRAAVRKEWADGHVQERIAEYYDLVLVYGAPSVFDPIAEYEFPSALAERTKYCGYVVNKPERGRGGEMAPAFQQLDFDFHPCILATTGGGEDGFTVLETFVRAAEGAPWKGIAVAGPMLSKREFSILEALAGRSGVTLHKFIPRLPDLFWKLDGLVCMGGYNTLVEAASQAIPTICIPRSSPRSEQLLRARVFEQLGLLRCISSERLTVERLRQEVNASLETRRGKKMNRSSSGLDFEGARRAASHLLRVIGMGRRRKASRLERVAP
jgi:predicted glycosyltransferase